MTTSHETLTASRRRRALALVTAALVSVSLAACVPQSADAAREYARTLEGASAVDSVAVGISTPLPFTVQASLTVYLAPDVTRASLNELRELACSTTVNASITLDFAYEFEGGALLTQRSIRKCGKEPVAFLDVLPVIKAHESELESVGWREREDDDGEHLVVEMFLIDESNAGASAAITDELLAALPNDPIVEVATRSFDVAPASVGDARKIAQAVVGLAETVPVARATYHDGLFVQLDTAEPDSVDIARAYLTKSHADVRVGAVVDSSVDVSGGIPAQASLDAERALSEAGLADKVSVSKYGLNVWTTSPAAIITVAAFLESEGMGQVSVDYSIFSNDEVIATVKPETHATVLTMKQLADAQTIFDSFAETGNLGMLYYTPSTLQVYLTEEVYDDKASIDEFLDILHDLRRPNVLNGTFEFVELNNREVAIRG